MSSTYSAFLKTPSSDQLTANASITYVPTTTIINGQAAILKHLTALARQVSKEKEKTLDSIESADGLFLETETTLLFNDSGGVYVPGVDGNMLDEKRATMPITHVVRFDSQQRIKQIRLYWDQGALLRQVEVIGRSGRNWPIRDSSAQLDAITRSVREAQSNKGGESSTSRDTRQVVVDQHRKQESVTATKDPHASLALFAPRDPNEITDPRAHDIRHARKGSAKPAANQYDDLFVGEESASRNPDSLTFSPTKAGAGGNFKENRLFSDDSEELLQSPERKKTFDQKYSHFSLEDNQPAETRIRGTRGGPDTRNQATFSFDDFSTPPKLEHKTRPDYDRHWGPTTDEDYPPSLPKRPIVHQPRPDSTAHYTLTDVPSKDDKSPQLRTTTSVNNSRRADDFAAHYAIADKSPGTGTPQPVRGAARADQESHWGFSTPVPEKKIFKTSGDGMGGRSLDIFGGEEPTKTKKIFKTTGDGMGGHGTRTWGFGDDSDPDVPKAENVSARTRRARAQPNSSDDF